MGTDCTFTEPCHRYRGLLAEIDELKHEIERLRNKLSDALAEAESLREVVYAAKSN